MVESKYANSLGRHWAMGVVCVGVFTFGTVALAAMTQVTGAVIASGTVVTTLAPQQIQHRDGGIIAGINVRNQDHVAVGEVLLTLDGSVVRGALAVIDAQLEQLLLQAARLEAAAAGRDVLVLSDELAARKGNADFAAIVSAQQALLLQRQASNEARTAQLTQQIDQLNRSVEGHEAERVATKEQLAMVEQELVRIVALRADNLVAENRVTDQLRAKSQLIGQVSSLDAAIASAHAAVAETRFQMIELQDRYKADSLAELEVVSQNISDLRQKRLLEVDRLAKLDIRSPIGGFVHESIADTVGGVAGSGQVLMQIVPDDSALLLEAKVNPIDIEKVSVGQAVDVRVLTRESRAAAELVGTVTRIAPTLTTDPRTDVSYYVARIAVEGAGIADLKSGMPAEIFIRTGQHTILSYLIEPVTFQLSRAFRE